MGEVRTINLKTAKTLGLALVCTENSDSHVAVMQSANERMRPDATDALNRARERRIFVQRSVRSQIVVIAGIGSQDPA